MGKNGDDLVAQTVAAVIARLREQAVESAGGGGHVLIPVGVSARHVHLSAEDVAELFGPGHVLTPVKPLQPGQYAAAETVTLVGPKAVLAGVRVLGPARGHTQVEVSKTDCLFLGIPPVARVSGDIAGSPGATIAGPRGARFLPEGVIVARRHIHVTPDEAAAWGVGDGETVSVAVTRGERALTFGCVLVRVSPAARAELHIDTDEANAAGLTTGDAVRLIREADGGSERRC